MVSRSRVADESAGKRPLPPSRADRRLAAAVGLQLRAYARHSSLADSCQQCGVSKEDVALHHHQVVEVLKYEGDVFRSLG